MDKIINYYIYNLDNINKLVENTCIVLFMIIFLYLVRIYKTNVKEIKNKTLPVLITLFIIPLSINTLGKFLNTYMDKNINIEKNEIILLDRIEEIRENNRIRENPNSNRLPSQINNFNKDSI